jgi:hypothetical protein
MLVRVLEHFVALDALTIINRHRDKCWNHQYPRDCDFIGGSHTVIVAALC